mgnify:CR=1 FL=1
MFTNEELKKINEKLEEIEKKTPGGIENIKEFDQNVSEEIIKFDSSFKKSRLFFAKDEKEVAEKIDLKIFHLIVKMLKKSQKEMQEAMQMGQFLKIPVLDRILKFKIDFLPDTIYDDLGIKKLKIGGENLQVQIKKDATPEQVERIMELNKQLREKMAKAKIKTEKAEVID